jgi:hypothetical protein
MSQTVSLPLAHLAPLAAAVATGAPDVAAVLGAAAPDVATAAELVDAAPVVAGALVEPELLPHADAVRATAIPTDAT